MQDKKKLCMIICLFHLEQLVKSSQPLFLTPYIDSGHIQEAQRYSLVDPANFVTDFPKQSHAGFITVNKTLGNHLFFWFFPNEKNSSAPLLIWLNGGPGVSSMFGLLWENGPIEICTEISENCHYKTRQHSWSQHFSMLYIDSPVGAGYSFTESGTSGERVTQQGVSEDLYSFVEQFYALFPDYKKKELYIGGQSYAGKYVPYLALLIHTKKQARLSDIPLTGIYLGGPLFDPPTQSPAYFSYLYSMGAISYQQMIHNQDVVANLFKDFENGRIKVDGLSSLFNILVPDVGLDSNDNYVTGEKGNYKITKRIMSSPAFREAVHVSDQPFFAVNARIFNKFVTDVFVSAKSKMAVLMDNYKVLIFTGDTDVIVNSIMVDTALLTTPWSNQLKYNASSRTPWWSPSGEAGPELWGFYTFVGQFCRVSVRGAGHQTPHDQPVSTVGMMRQFVQYGCIRSHAPPSRCNLWPIFLKVCENHYELQNKVYPSKCLFKSD
ncbi:hypothetical protein Btru_022914 [Bulinus truncatus]|nr:hypothetical protein Btru_022914 [Bulinus truncatus]